MLSVTKIVAAALLGLAHFCAFSADDFSVLQDEPRTGTSIRKRVFFGSEVPVSKTYEQLTEAEQEIIRNRYINMPKTDEPPYPRYGLVNIYKAITRAQSKLLVSGKVEMYVTVDGEGIPKRVTVYQSPDYEVSKIFSTILMLTEFKPAVCGGQPCTMDFPLVVTLKVEL